MKLVLGEKIGMLVRIVHVKEENNMCMKCGNEDKEICALCDEHYGKKGVTNPIVVLDPDTLGEIQCKLNGIITDMMEIYLDINPDVDMCDRLIICLELMKKSLKGELTSADLDYMDCL